MPLLPALSRTATAAAFAATLSAFAVIASAAPVMAQHADFPIIVDVAGFEGLVAQGAKIIDLRAPALFAQGHIPGAVNLPASLLNVAEIDGIRNELPTDEALVEALQAAGLNDGDLIVLYDHGSLPGRAYIALDYAGLDVHVLDGGITAFTGTLSTDPSEIARGSFSLASPRDFLVTQEQVAANSTATIIDGRSEQSFADGHIPGALSLSAGLFMQADRSPEAAPALLDTLLDRGLAPEDEIISYCGSGAAAAINYLSLRNLGYENVVLYDGSWDEWSRDPAAGQDLALGNYTLGAALDLDVPGAPRLLELAEIEDLLGDPEVVILDVRNTDDYSIGHIPGAVHVYWNDTLDENRTLLPLSTLQSLYADAGATPDKRVVIFSRGGVQLSHTFTVLKLLGYDEVDLFAGRFEGWAI